MFNGRKSKKPIRIGSINGETNKIRLIESIFLGPEHQVEGVLVPELALNTATIQRPNCLSKYDNQWAIQLGCHHGNGGQVPAQILVGVDSTKIFPVDVNNPDGTLVQTKDARLARSILTGRYLLFGSAKPDDELYVVQFPTVEEVGSGGVNTLGVASMELVEFYRSKIEDIVTI